MQADLESIVGILDFYAFLHVLPFQEGGEAVRSISGRHAHNAETRSGDAADELGDHDIREVNIAVFSIYF